MASLYRAYMVDNKRKGVGFISPAMLAYWCSILTPCQMNTRPKRTNSSALRTLYYLQGSVAPPSSGFKCHRSIMLNTTYRRRCRQSGIHAHRTLAQTPLEHNARSLKRKHFCQVFIYTASLPPPAPQVHNTPAYL